jgi:hypothetical protein
LLTSFRQHKTVSSGEPTVAINLVVTVMEVGQSAGFTTPESRSDMQRASRAHIVSGSVDHTVSEASSTTDARAIGIGQVREARDRIQVNICARSIRPLTRR